MRGPWRSRLPGLARAGVLALASLCLATAAAAALEGIVRVPDASPVYLVAVVVCGIGAGTGAAIAAAIGAFLIDNFLFTEPLYTFAISDAGVLLADPGPRRAPGRRRPMRGAGTASAHTVKQLALARPIPPLCGRAEPRWCA